MRHRLEKAFEVEAVRRALEGLPPPQREALLLRFVDRLSEREVAAILGCQVSTVHAMVAQGLRRLRRRLADKPSPLPSSPAPWR